MIWLFAYDGDKKLKIAPIVLIVVYSKSYY